MSEVAKHFTWEAIIRAVTMAGRPDQVWNLQLKWHTYFQILDTASRTLRDLKARIGEKDWSGAGADAYRGHYESLVKQIDDFYARMSTMIHLSGDTGTALATAIASIPLPDMGDVHNLGMHGIRYEDAQTGNQVQYHFFRTHRDRYADNGFRDYVGHRIAAAYPDATGRTVDATANRKAAQANLDADRWYDEGTNRARAAFDTLLAAYAEQHAAIPTYDEAPTLDPRTRTDYGSDGGGSGSGGYGGVDSSGPSVGSPPPPKTGAGYGTTGFASRNGAGSPAAAVEPSQWNRSSGTSLAGTGHPGSAGATPAVDAGIGGGVGGAGFGGGAGIGGGAAGFGPTGYSAGASGYRGADATEPRGPQRAAGVGSGRGGASGPAGDTYGGVSPGGAGGKQDGEERQTWLIEDDDVWSVPLGPPPVIE